MLRDEGRSGDWIEVEHPCIIRPADEFGEQGKAGGAAATQAGASSAGLGRSYVGMVHEEAELVVMSSCGLLDLPKRIQWPLRSWSFLP